MELLTDILQYFISDPMRILSLIGGTGGVVYWYDRYRNRVRLKIKFINYGLSSKTGESTSALSFEAENLGTQTTSLDSQIFLYGFIPVIMQRGPKSKTKRKKYLFEIDSTERTLKPNVPKVFTAKGYIDDMASFLWFMTYVIKPTRGKTFKVRVRSANKTVINIFQYLIELSGYMMFNHLKHEENT